MMKLKERLQNFFWIYLCKIFEINNVNEYKLLDPKIKCEFIPITFNNYHLVQDFREESRVINYRNKLNKKEIGFFAEYNGRMIGSIWATINRGKVPNVVRTFIDLMPNEGLVHDIVVDKKFRGMSIGPYLLGKIAIFLLTEYGVKRIIVDVNIKNRSSLRMMKKASLHLFQIMFYVSIFGKRVLHLELRRES